MSVEAWLIILFWLLAFGGVICWAVEKAQTPKPSKKPIESEFPTYLPRHNAKTREKVYFELRRWQDRFDLLLASAEVERSHAELMVANMNMNFEMSKAMDKLEQVMKNHQEEEKH